MELQMSYKEDYMNDGKNVNVFPNCLFLFCRYYITLQIYCQ